jgi:hypothetical protein
VERPGEKAWWKGLVERPGGKAWWKGLVERPGGGEEGCLVALEALGFADNAAVEL